MTDLHTHILPEMDDGSASVAESLTLLQMEWDQGVRTVALTPHFYRWRESAETFLARRQQSFDRLRAALPSEAPSLLLGAEVAWFPTLASYEPLEKLCLGGSGCFLLELPLSPWPAKLPDQIYDLTCATGLTPILAHVERYLPTQRREQLEELTSMGLPMQMNADSLLRPFRRGKCLKLLSHGQWFLGSDCHNTAARPPRLAKAVRFLSGKWSDAQIRALTSWTPSPRAPKELIE